MIENKRGKGEGGEEGGGREGKRWKEKGKDGTTRETGGGGKGKRGTA